MSVVGRATDNQNLVIEGSRFYGKALWELQRALWDERLVYRDETLAASHALVLYEVMLWSCASRRDFQVTESQKLLESPDNNLSGWVAHTQGLARLIEARGPESYDTPFANMLFSSFRHTVV